MPNEGLISSMPILSPSLIKNSRISRHRFLMEHRNSTRKCTLKDEMAFSPLTVQKRVTMSQLALRQPVKPFHGCDRDVTGSVPCPFRLFLPPMRRAYPPRENSPIFPE